MTDLSLRDIVEIIWAEPVLNWLWMPVAALFGLWILRIISEGLIDIWADWRAERRRKK